MRPLGERLVVGDRAELDESLGGGCGLLQNPLLTLERRDLGADSVGSQGGDSLSQHVELLVGVLASDGLRLEVDQVGGCPEGLDLRVDGRAALEPRQHP